MIAAFRRNAIVYAPAGFQPSTVLVPGADLNKAALTTDDVTAQLVRILNTAYHAGRTPRPAKK